VAVGGLRLAGMGLGLLVTILIGRWLGPAALGVYGYSVIVLSLVAVPVSYGWAALLLRRVAAAVHDRGWGEAKGLFIRGTQFAAALAAVAGLLGLGGVALFPEVLPMAIGPGVVALLAAVLFLDQISALRMAFLRGLGHPVLGQLPETLVRPTLIVAGFCALALAAAMHPNLLQAFIAMAVAAALSALLGAAVLWRTLPQDVARAAPTFHVRDWSAAAGALTVNSGLMLLNSYADILMLGALGSLHDVGVYRVAGQIALLSGFVYTALNMIAAPRFAYLRAAGDRVALARTAALAARLAFLGTLPLPIVFWLFGPAILEAVFGPAFVAARAPMFVLFAAQAVNAAAGMASSLIIASGRERTLARFTLAAVVVNVAVSLSLIPRWGAMGAATANLAAGIAWNASMWIFARRAIGVDTSIVGSGAGLP
jgi:O-antigen/teichoic acid export membrane protein